MPLNTPRFVGMHVLLWLLQAREAMKNWLLQNTTSLSLVSDLGTHLNQCLTLIYNQFIQIFGAAVALEKMQELLNLLVLQYGTGSDTVTPDIDDRPFTMGTQNLNCLGVNTVLPGDQINLPKQIVGLPAGEKVVKFVVGHSSSMALTDGHHLYGWGHNQMGELGLGDNLERAVPVLLTADLVSDIWGNAEASENCFWYKRVVDNRIYGSGDNIYSHCKGNGNTVDTNVWVEAFAALLAENVVMVDGGLEFSLMLCDNHNLYMVGSNLYGQGCNGGAAGAPASYTAPRLIANDAIYCACGAATGAYITTANRLYMWGRDYQSEIGDNSLVDKTVMTEPLWPGATPLITAVKMDKLNLNNTCTAARDSNGNMWCFGMNDQGQRGNGAVNPRQINIPFQCITGNVTNHFRLHNKTIAAIVNPGILYIWGDSHTAFEENTLPGASILTPTEAAVSIFKRAVKYIALGQTHALMVCGSGITDLC